MKIICSCGQEQTRKIYHVEEISLHPRHNDYYFFIFSLCENCNNRLGTEDLGTNNILQVVEFERKLQLESIANTGDLCQHNNRKFRPFKDTIIIDDVLPF